MNLIHFFNEIFLIFFKGKELVEDCLGKVLVFDLGGGTFDVSILDLTNDVYQVRSSWGMNESTANECFWLVRCWRMLVTIIWAAKTSTIDWCVTLSMKSNARWVTTSRLVSCPSFNYFLSKGFWLLKYFLLLNNLIEFKLIKSYWIICMEWI